MKRILVTLFLATGLTASSQSPLLESPVQAIQLPSAECTEKCQANYMLCMSPCGDNAGCRWACGVTALLCARKCNPGLHEIDQ